MILNFINKIIFRVKTSKFNLLLKKTYNNDEKKFSNLVKFVGDKSIALVGGSKKLLLKENNIDDYGIVIRINNLPNNKVHKFLGKRCDILMLSRNPIHLINKNFIKIWMTNKNRYLLNYAKGEIFTYPLNMWNELYNTLQSRPTTGAMALHFLKTLFPNNKIYLFGFDHNLGNVWYDNNQQNISHPHNELREKIYFQSTVNDSIKYMN